MQRTPSAILWEVRGRSGLVTSCYLHRLPGPRFAVNVTISDSEVMREHFAREPDAIQYAQLLQRDFASQGWTETLTST